MRSPRFMLTVTKRQIPLLKAEAERLDITVAELIRRIIDQHFEKRGQ